MKRLDLRVAHWNWEFVFQFNNHDVPELEELGWCEGVGMDFEDNFIVLAPMVHAAGSKHIALRENPRSKVSKDYEYRWEVQYQLMMAKCHRDLRTLIRFGLTDMVGELEDDGTVSITIPPACYLAWPASGSVFEYDEGVRMVEERLLSAKELGLKNLPVPPPDAILGDGYFAEAYRKVMK